MGEFRAIRWEEITVPAGRFRALRIFHYGWGYTMEYWYAPKVKNFVRMERYGRWLRDNGLVEELMWFRSGNNEEGVK